MDLEKHAAERQRPDEDEAAEQRRCNLETYSSIPEHEAQQRQQPRARDGDDGDNGSDGEPLGHNTSILHRVVSRVTSRSFVDPEPPPDGGWRAWAMCK